MAMRPTRQGPRPLRRVASLLLTPSPAAVQPLSRCRPQQPRPAFFSSSSSSLRRPPSSLLLHGTRPGLSGLSHPHSVSHRNFHLSSLVHPLVAVPVDAAETFILQLHATTHTPWFVTLPLVAIGVNLVFRLPFSIYARRLAQGRARLNPLLEAWAAQHAKTVHQERRRQIAPAGDPSDAEAEAMKRFRRTSRRVYKEFGLQQWKLYGSIATMPPWLTVIEAIRRLCGAPTGLLGLLLRRGRTEAAASPAAEAVGNVAGAAAAEVTAAGATTAGDTAAAFTSAFPPVDPSLATGGCLWFPDLTMPDPYHILPFALSAMLVMNVLPRTEAGLRSLFGLSPSSDNGIALVSTEGAMSRGIQRTLLIMSAGVGFVTLQFPSAILLYWLSSAATSFTITRAVHKALPVPRQDTRRSNKVDYPWIQPARPTSLPRRKQETI